MTTELPPNPRSDLPIPPGELLKEELAAIGMTPRQLALQTQYSVHLIDAVIAGEKPIRDEIAVRLEQALGISARLWVNLEAQYQATKANQRSVPLS